MTRLRLLIVDDSRTMQQLIANVLSVETDIEVVGFASDALEAREAIKRLDPDVITLDVEMPKMNGLDFLEKIMRLRPTPVIMVSNHTDASTETTIQALAIGAIDCVAKPKPEDKTLFVGLADKIRTAATLKRRLSATLHPAPAAPPHGTAPTRFDTRIMVAIGSSAGGIEALSAVLDGFPANCPPVVITQHMPAGFTRSLASRLDRLCDANVEEATDRAPLRAGTIYVAPGGSAHLEVAGGERLHCRLREGATVSGHRPSVDVLFESVARTVQANAIGVILSGMGRDGAAGLLAMRQAGATTFGQDEATSFIYGMPRTAFEAGGVARQLPVTKIGAAILASSALDKGSTPCR